MVGLISKAVTKAGILNAFVRLRKFPVPTLGSSTVILFLALKSFLIRFRIAPTIWSFV